jgi:hypothetical protein
MEGRHAARLTERTWFQFPGQPGNRSSLPVFWKWGVLSWTPHEEPVQEDGPIDVDFKKYQDVFFDVARSTLQAYHTDAGARLETDGSQNSRSV